MSLDVWDGGIAYVSAIWPCPWLSPLSWRQPGTRAYIVKVALSCSLGARSACTLWFVGWPVRGRHPYGYAWVRGLLHVRGTGGLGTCH